MDQDEKSLLCVYLCLDCLYILTTITMDQDKKKNREKEKKKLKEKSQKVADLCFRGEYQACLDYITTLADNAVRNFKIYEGSIHCLTRTERYGEALALIEGHKVHGHSRNSFSFLTCLCEAVCNFELSNHLKAYHMFKDLLGLKDIDDETRQYCTRCMKEILQKSGEEIENSIKQKADELLQENEVDKPSSSSTSNVDPPVVVDESCAEILQKSGEEIENSVKQKTDELEQETEVDKPSSSSTSNVDPPAIVVKSCPVVVESSSVACSSITVASSSQKTPESLVFSENMSFEMDELDKQSYVGSMKIGLHTFQKALIIPNEKQRKCLDESTYKAPIETKGNPFLLKSEFLVYSPSLSSNLCVVEPVYPVQVFFERKLMDFNRTLSASSSNNKEEWWKFIHECFQTIFRGIICGLFAIHSAQKTCGDLDCSMYVTEGGEGRIFYVSGEIFSESQAQKDLDDLLSTMEGIVTLIDPRPRTEKQVWLQEFEDSYKLPRKLRDFFESLRYKKVANHKIQTTWLIDHPFFWPFGHEFGFMRILNDVFREGLIDEGTFVSYLPTYSGLRGWKLMACTDSLLNAIYAYKGDNHYAFGSETEAIHFTLAVLNHANDRNYSSLRGETKLTPVDIAQRIATVFPTIYNILYDVMCLYANDLENFAELHLLSRALERCSSLSP